MMLRSDLLVSLVDAVADREYEQEVADLVQITNEFAARNTTGSSMHLSELYKRRVQTIERILKRAD